MTKLSTDLGVSRLLHPREGLYADGALGSVNAAVITACDGSGVVAVDLRGTFNMTVEVAGTVDGVNWTPIPVVPVNVASRLYVAAITGTTAGVWIGDCSPYRQVRARVTAWTSGSATARILANIGAYSHLLAANIASAMVTVTAAVSLIATLTLPAPGAGLRQYVTYIDFSRTAAALLVAGATPVLLTNTGLPNTPPVAFPADAAPAGSLVRHAQAFPHPLAAAAQNAAMTFVGPATTNCIWRLTAAYYVAP